MEEHPVVTVFRSRLLPEAEANGYPDLATRMEARARDMPGFVDFKTFVATDGERLSLVVFDTAEHHRAWRDDPEHRAAQARGRREFYAGYSISVCEERHHRNYRAGEGLGPAAGQLERRRGASPTLGMSDPA